MVWTITWSCFGLSSAISLKCKGIAEYSPKQLHGGKQEICHGVESNSLWVTKIRDLSHMPLTPAILSDSGKVDAWGYCWEAEWKGRFWWCYFLLFLFNKILLMEKTEGTISSPPDCSLWIPECVGLCKLCYPGYQLHWIEKGWWRERNTREVHTFHWQIAGSSPIWFDLWWLASILIIKEILVLCKGCDRHWVNCTNGE